MQNKGIFKRVIPFAAAAVVGLFITSLFVDIPTPQFGGKSKRKAEMRRLKAENEHLKNENLRLRNLLEQNAINSSMSGVEVDLNTGAVSSEVYVKPYRSEGRGLGRGHGITLKQMPASER